MATIKLSPGVVARFDLGCGDSYIGTVKTVAPGYIVLSNYAAWYAEADGPFNSGVLDEVSFLTDRETIISIF